MAGAGVRADAIVHLGKHGTLEWLPGKALALSDECFPEAALPPLPHLYPFIVNDPGEGTQAKRRAQAVIVDHLTPPLTRAGSYGLPAELERLIDEYYQAAQGDPRRVGPLAAAILEQARAAGLDGDCGIAAGEEPAAALRKLDGFLCELKELQIRDGLHVFGQSPEGGRLDALLVAFARAARGACPRDMSLLRALAADLGLASDPLTLDPAEPWAGPRPPVLGGDAPWRTAGDTVERLEALALALVAGEARTEAGWGQTRAVLDWIERDLRPAVAGCGKAEIAALLAGLEGRLVPPGPSGAPSRGRPEVLPTGRNFYSVDTRAVPTQAAWQLGWKSAAILVERHAQEHGDYPARVALSAWGTANMRTGGDDVAQALALMGVRPVWEPASGRVTGFEILPASVLDRPRVDVTLRMSGFFRDAFPGLVDLVDRRRVRSRRSTSRQESTRSPRALPPTASIEAQGVMPEDAARRAGYRVFGSKPGAYGAGLQTLIDERIWRRRRRPRRGLSRLERLCLWRRRRGPGRAADARRSGSPLPTRYCTTRTTASTICSTATTTTSSRAGWRSSCGICRGARRRSGTTTIRGPRRRASAACARRSAASSAAAPPNPRWIAGVMRHGYKGAAEIAATVDYLFAFAATARAVDDAHFDALYDAYIADERCAASSPRTTRRRSPRSSRRFAEAIDRGLWRPRRNSARERSSWAGR